MNRRDAPGYHVSLVEQAIETIEAVGAPNLKLMFDGSTSAATQSW
jgi:hydroxypyruvate isomerase